MFILFFDCRVEFKVFFFEFGLDLGLFRLVAWWKGCCVSWSFGYMWFGSFVLFLGFGCYIKSLVCFVGEWF